MHPESHGLTKFWPFPGETHLTLGQVEDTSQLVPEAQVISPVLGDVENILVGWIKNREAVQGLGVGLELVVQGPEKGTAVLAPGDLSL